MSLLKLGNITKPEKHKSCGPCTACCTAMAIYELDKPEFTPCENLIELGLPGRPAPELGRATGCAIYGRHPGSCQAFLCVWVAGGIEDDAEYRRPDKIGLVFNYQEDTELARFSNRDPSLPAHMGPVVLSAHEAWPRAAEGEKAKYLLERLRQRYVILLFVWGDEGRRTILAPDNVRGSLERYARAAQFRRALMGPDRSSPHRFGDELDLRAWIVRDPANGPEGIFFLTSIGRLIFKRLTAEGLEVVLRECEHADADAFAEKNGLMEIDPHEIILYGNTLRVVEVVRHEHSV